MVITAGMLWEWEDSVVTSVLPNGQLLRGEQVEPVPSLDDSHLPDEDREVLVHRGFAPQLYTLVEVSSSRNA